MGFGLGTEIGMVASIFHILSHAATKSLLFISAIGLTDVSKGSRKFQDLTGAAYRHKNRGNRFYRGFFVHGRNAYVIRLREQAALLPRLPSDMLIKCFLPLSYWESARY